LIPLLKRDAVALNATVSEDVNRAQDNIRYGVDLVIDPSRLVLMHVMIGPTSTVTLDAIQAWVEWFVIFVSLGGLR
jgi:hypothetical protein